MATDMDIEMDLDVGMTEEELMAQSLDIILDIEASSEQPMPILSTPNDTSDANSSEPVPEKVHVRGLDNLTTKDIHAFAAEHSDGQNHAEIAQQALIAFSAVTIQDVSQIAPLQTLSAKPFSGHPQTHLEVRLAVLGDRKQRGARERSRFYLFNPEYDPAERRKREGRGGYKGKYRDRDDGGYRSQRYDDREQRKRQDGDADAGFDASLYDDDAPALAKRASRNRRRDSSSGSDSRRRGRRSYGGTGKELFPDRVGNEGRLRDRSASPMQEDDRESRRADGRKDQAAAANREKARLIKEQLQAAETTRELFPTKVNGKHRRSDAFDAADETADLFSSRMAVPFVDGGNDERPLTLASRITNGRNSSRNEPAFNIRGAAKNTQTFNIKGAAGVKELFPDTFGDNSGKELFSGRLEGRGQRRQKAGDLFD